MKTVDVTRYGPSVATFCVSSEFLTLRGSMIFEIFPTKLIENTTIRWPAYAIIDLNTSWYRYDAFSANKVVSTHVINRKYDKKLRSVEKSYSVMGTFGRTLWRYGIPPIPTHELLKYPDAQS